MARTKAQQDEAFKNPAVPVLGLGAVRRARPPTAPSSARSWQDERPRTAPLRPMTSRATGRTDHAGKPPPGAAARARTASAHGNKQHSEKLLSPADRLFSLRQRAESASDSSSPALLAKLPDQSMLAPDKRPGKRPRDDLRR